jgi:hypothetical protein
MASQAWRHRTIALLRERGWKQRSYGVPDGPYCIEGAIRWANRDLDVEREIEELAREVGMAIWQWNDSPGRTFNDVVALLSS